MNGLIERLKKATGHDDRLNDAIAVSQGWIPHRTTFEGMETATWTTPAGERRVLCPWYTSSIDAARRLVPEGCRWSVSQGDYSMPGSASVWSMGARRPEEVSRFGHHFKMTPERDRPEDLPAIALSIAALKAQAALVPNDGAKR